MLRPPSAATVGLTPNSSKPRPPIPVTAAKRVVAPGVTKPRTNGRFRVRLIMASYFGSNSMLSVFALADDRAVPIVKNSKVRVDSDGDAVVDGSSNAGTGKSE